LRLLFLNWRDIKHPEAGGAEVLTHEVMKRLVNYGYDVTLFCPRVEGRFSEEVIDGVKIIRKGGKFTVYACGRKYFKKNKEKYDLVFDEVNPRPFLNPKVLDGKPSVLLFHQMIREEWFYEMPFPLSYFCYFYENRWLLPYRDSITITVSESSRKDLEGIGFTNVKVIPMGISVKPLDGLGKKNDIPTLVFIGRLKKHKLPDHAIMAFSIIREQIPSAQMWVIGDGYMLSELKKMGDQNITFFGHVKDQTKYDLLSKAHLVLVPSLREGWGLVVSESNAMGTPVVAYDVNGLRDSVVEGKNGSLVRNNNPHALAYSALKILQNQEMMQNLSINALEYARQFSWNKTADYIHQLIESL
jgi:glycosyltransferase involved in cell wall biosynthesis